MSKAQSGLLAVGIVGGLAVLVGGVVLVVAALSQKPQQAQLSQTVQETVKDDDISVAYDRNIVAADLRFKGKRLRVQGNASIEGSGEKAAITMHGFHGGGYHVYLHFPLPVAQVAQLRDGQAVLVEGVFKQRASRVPPFGELWAADIDFEDCRIVGLGR
jgi:hypothetical protein